MTALSRQRDRSSWATTAIRRVISTFRYVNDELVRAHEAMALPARVPQPGARARTTGGAASAPVDGASAPPRPQTSAAPTAEGSQPAA
jgi:hypothetical protein